jgi:hypothetical protein
MNKLNINQQGGGNISIGSVIQTEGTSNVQQDGTSQIHVQGEIQERLLQVPYRCLRESARASQRMRSRELRERSHP